MHDPTYSLRESGPQVSESTRLGVLGERTSDAEPQVLIGDLRYRAEDPYAVSMDFRSSRGTVTWTFGRDLLAQGLHEPAGLGDVHVWPTIDDRGRPVVAIALKAPTGAVTVTAPRKPVASFVRRSLRVVPQGGESAHVDIDAAVARLLS
ncbi:MAG: SsgA family sporulation/cell division regulator [Marmoricola sp.]